jgi:membrane-associated protease RseP (regulator of RpoE activity)
MGGRVLTGRLRPGLDPDSPVVSTVLDGWPGSHSARKGEHGWELMLFQPIERRERWWLHATLLAVTLFSTSVAGSMLSGYWPIEFIVSPTQWGWGLPVPVSLDLRALVAGLPFGISLVLILAVHEAGHYVAARRHSISVTPPYFIPFPPYVSIIGTLGAFIRLRSPVMSRGALLDVGAAGPVLSFVASIPFLVWGLLNSRLRTGSPGSPSLHPDQPSLFLVEFLQEKFWLGSSVAFSALARIVPGFETHGQILELHPVAFAGWLGLFVTALNLLPLSQLDGGHILYAALGRRQKVFAWLFFVLLIPLGFLWAGWWLWATLVFVIGRGRIWHPPLFDAEHGLNAKRTAVAIAAAVVFALCFVPAPFRL